MPKQFCSLTGQRTLLEDTIARARGITTDERICSIVDHRHREFWRGLLRNAILDNVIVHPWGRGTGIGILHSLLLIDAKDPAARLVILPADHYVRDESILRGSMDAALELVAPDAAGPILLGITPEHADTELGYIVPADDATTCNSVQRFIEKPDWNLASEIIRAGGLWNSFIMVARARELLRMFMLRYEPIVLEMQAVIGRGARTTTHSPQWFAIADLYERLPSIDFSRDLLEPQAQRWRVIEVPACGWSDLGTPARVAETLRRVMVFEPKRAKRSVGRRPNLHHVLFARR